MSSKFPDLAVTENFQLWVDRDDGMITLVLSDRLVSVGLTKEELDELVDAVTQAQAEFRRLDLEENVEGEQPH